jgi:hypothetical protein
VDALNKGGGVWEIKIVVELVLLNVWLKEQFRKNILIIIIDLWDEKCLVEKKTKNNKNLY